MQQKLTEHAGLLESRFYFNFFKLSSYLLYAQIGYSFVINT